MDKGTALKYSKEYAEKVRKKFSPQKMYMYGSCAYGNPGDESDIDIAVIFNGFNGDWLSTSGELWGMTESISTRIEPVLLDIASDKSGFAHEIERTGIEI